MTLYCPKCNTTCTFHPNPNEGQEFYVASGNAEDDAYFDDIENGHWHCENPECNTNFYLGINL